MLLLGVANAIGVCPHGFHAGIMSFPLLVLLRLPDDPVGGDDRLKRPGEPLLPVRGAAYGLPERLDLEVELDERRRHELEQRARDRPVLALEAVEVLDPARLLGGLDGVVDERSRPFLRLLSPTPLFLLLSTSSAGAGTT